MRPATRLASYALRLCLLVLGLGLALLVGGSRAADSSPPVLVAQLHGEVDPLTARYVERAVQTAGQDHAALLVITIDTPGGLDPSMRQMVQALLSSPVPSVAYVSPSGARAASAGVFVAEAANVVAMAPGTTIGAAHPVNSDGNNIASDLRDKITNDAAAYIAGIARQRGRDDHWVQDAVRQSVALDAQGAVNQRVADYLAPDLPALLTQVQGRTVNTSAGAVTIRTAGDPIEYVGMNPVERAFQTMADPTVAYLLLTLGFYAILIELFHPGALLPGVAGAICVILALVAFATLPVNWGGVLLILVAVVLFVVDVKAATHGALTVAALVCFILGSLLLYSPVGARSPSLPQVAVARPVMLVLVAVGVLLGLLIATTSVRIRRRPPLMTLEHLTGAIGTTRSALDPDGVVLVEGQDWSARLRDGTLPAGKPVRVLQRTGLTLTVEPVAPADATPEQEAPLWPPPA